MYGISWGKTLRGLRLTFPDYIVIFGYFVVVLLVGVYFNKRQVASQDYFAGGQQVPWWLAGISHYMSSFSAFTFIAYSQMAYMYGFVAITLFWTTVPACAMGGLIFARRWRRARVITPVEFLEKRFNAPLRQMFAWAGIPAKIFDDALKVFATALILSAGVGADLKTAIIVCGAVTVTYTLLGGLWALVVTDYVQFLMKIAAMVLLLPLAVWSAGGPVRAFQGLPRGFLHLTGGPYGWTYLTSFTLLIIISYNATWALAQKYYSVPDEVSASKAAYLSAALNFIGTPLMLLPAIIGRNLLPDLIAQHRTADTYVLLVLKLLPGRDGRNHRRSHVLGHHGGDQRRSECARERIDARLLPSNVETRQQRANAGTDRTAFHIRARDSGDRTEPVDCREPSGIACFTPW